MQKLESLYIHFPFCRHLCNYCDFYKMLNDSAHKQSEFEQSLDQQMAFLKNLFRHESAGVGKLKTVYIGGGTPSLWGEQGAKFLQNFFSKWDLCLDQSCEFTLEVNPGAWSAGDICAWEKIGVNRFSVGLQSLNSKFLKTLDRVHSINDSLDTLDFFKQKKYSVDFMLGLPFSDRDKRDVFKELEDVLTYNPSHISLYILTTKEKYCHQSSLPSEDWISDEYLGVSEFLVSRGFSHYEVSNFALPGSESQHNLNYWKSAPVWALGPSSTGLINSSPQALRYKWKTKSFGLYFERLGAEEQMIEEIYLKLRTNLGINLNDWVSKDSERLLIGSWEKNGWVLDKDPLRLSAKGYLILDSLVQEVLSLTDM